MAWKKYYFTYQTYELSVALTSLVSMVGAEVFLDFPARLPKDLGEHLAKGVREVLSEIEASRSDPSADVTIDRATLERFGDEGGFLGRFFDMMTTNVMLGYADLEVVDFRLQDVVCAQALVMYFAHLDAFMSDTVRTVCRVRPQVLSTGKKMDWQTIIALGGWDELVNHMTERYVFESGWGSVRQRVEFLRERLGLVIDLSESHLESLEETENIRHIVVHNGGRVSQEYIARTGRTDLELGTFVGVTLESVEGVMYLSRLLANGVFKAVSTKFFGKDESSLAGVWTMPRLGDSQVSLELL